MRVLGVDPGTGSMDILALEDSSNKILYTKTIERSKVTRNPSIVFEAVSKIRKEYYIEIMTAPSGYGIPLKKVQEASLEEINMATFVNCRDLEDSHQIHGLRSLMRMYHDSNLPAYFTPGAIHLPTIPEYRKTGRIDIGTADKIYTVAAGLAYLLDNKRIKPEDASAIIIEAGKAYTAGLLVEKGEIRDGVGGTSGWWGFLGGGFIDAETCYILSTLRPMMPKRYLFRGGAIEHEEDSRPSIISEAVIKTIATLLASAESRIDWIMLSGRMTRTPYKQVLRDSLEKLSRKLRNPPRTIWLKDVLGTDVKTGAYGAAVLASGIGGGRYAEIVESLSLWRSRGSVFDYLYPWGIGLEARSYFSHCPPAPS